MRAFGLLSLIIGIAITSFLAYRVYFGAGEEEGGGAPGLLETKNQAARDLAVAKAREIYQRQKAEGIDFSSGPCLTNNLLPDWVLDIAHDPREAVDDLPENQCSAFREGDAYHFVELDPDGNVIRAY